MTRFTLYGSLHSLPTYKIALMLRLSGVPFAFHYISFQKRMHQQPEFRALSRWARRRCWSISIASWSGWRRSSSI